MYSPLYYFVTTLHRNLSLSLVLNGNDKCRTIILHVESCGSTSRYSSNKTWTVGLGIISPSTVPRAAFKHYHQATVLPSGAGRVPSTPKGHFYFLFLFFTHFWRF